MGNNFKKYWRDELNRFKKVEDMGIIVGVEIIKPSPWPPALEMIKLKEQGLDVAEIAKRTEYSGFTVKRAFKTRGEDLRTGPQCSEYAGKVFTVDEALEKMPIPCGPNCVCTWQPVFKNAALNAK